MTFEAWYPKEKIDNQEQVVKDYCDYNHIDFNSLTDQDKDSIRKEIGYLTVKVEVIYPPMYLSDDRLIQEVGWDVTQKRIYLSPPRRSCSIERCKILGYKDTFCWVNDKAVYFSPLLKKSDRPIQE